AQENEQVLERAPQSVHAPCGYHVEFFPRHAVEQLVERRTFLLGAADPVVREDPRDLPAMALRDGFKFALLVLHRLPVGADPHIDRYPFRLAHGFLPSIELSRSCTTNK